MIKILLILIVNILLVSSAYAYKVFSYDENGNRIYRTIKQEEFAKNKNRPRRAYVRTPRTNWEISDKQRARKRTTSQTLNRK